MRRFFKVIVIIIICRLISSCGQYPCGRASSIIGLISFTDAESDTVIVRRFSRAANYSSLHDTLILTRLNSNFQKRNDSLLILHLLDDGKDIITGDYDFEVFLPKINRLFKLNEIAENMEYGHGGGGKIYCGNTFSSYKLNGLLIPVDKYSNIIYFKK